MSSPRIADRAAGTAARRSARLFFKLKDEKVVKALLLEMPGRSKARDAGTDYRNLGAQPIIRRHFKTPAFTQNMTELHALPDDLAFGQPRRRCIAAGGERQRRTQECRQ